MATKYKYYVDGKDGTIVRQSQDGFKEILHPDMTWAPYQADLIHDYSPIPDENVKGMIARLYESPQNS